MGLFYLYLFFIGDHVPFFFVSAHIYASHTIFIVCDNMGLISGVTFRPCHSMVVNPPVHTVVVNNQNTVFSFLFFFSSSRDETTSNETPMRTQWAQQQQQMGEGPR